MLNHRENFLKRHPSAGMRKSDPATAMLERLETRIKAKCAEEKIDPAAVL